MDQYRINKGVWGFGRAGAPPLHIHPLLIHICLYMALLSWNMANICPVHDLYMLVFILYVAHRCYNWSTDGSSDRSSDRSGDRSRNISSNSLVIGLAIGLEIDSVIGSVICPVKGPAIGPAMDPVNRRYAKKKKKKGCGCWPHQMLTWNFVIAKFSNGDPGLIA